MSIGKLFIPPGNFNYAASVPKKGGKVAEMKSEKRENVACSEKVKNGEIVLVC